MVCSARLLVLLIALGLVGQVGCGSTIPRAGGLIPDKTVQLSPSFGVPLETLVFWGAYVGAAYLILDPLAPNWEIEEAPLPGNHIHLAMKMRRFHAGGGGEARQVFQRRAKDLVQYGGFDGYEVMEYSEGLESSVLGSRRVTSGVIRLTGKGNVDHGDQPGQSGQLGSGTPTSGQTDQGSAPPARNTPARAVNPLS